MSKSCKKTKASQNCHDMHALCYLSFFQGNLKEALAISFESDTDYLNLYQNSCSKDNRITINQEKCMVGSLQMAIYIKQNDIVKALYSLERKLMLIQMKNIHIPSHDINTASNELVFNLIKFSKESKSIVLYLSYFSNEFIYCWIISSDKYELFSVPTQDQSNSRGEIETGISNEIELSERTLDSTFRKFPKPTKKYTDPNQAQCFLNKWVYLRLWEIIESKGLKHFAEAKRLIIIPENKLHLIPYTLLGNIGASNLLADYPILKHFSVSISPSFWVLSPTRMNSDKILVTEKENCVAFLIGNPANNLPYAEQEVTLVAQSLESCKGLSVCALTKELATKEIVLDTLVRSSVVHIASHGNLSTDEENIRAGTIQLRDGTLFSKEIEVR